MESIKSLWQNRMTATGAALAVIAVFLFIVAQMIELFRPTSNPYTGLWTFLILPMILMLGLVMIPVGYFLERRRMRKLYPEVPHWNQFPRFDPNNPRHLRNLKIFGAGTIICLPLIVFSSYEGYHFTDSTQFCGEVCHGVMHPEHTTYLTSPHARVACASCHIGPGAGWYVKSKLSGIRQVFAVTFNTYSKPIPSAIRELRPARETCEQCHWPQKFFGAQLRTRVHFIADEKNTRREIRVLVKTGGADTSTGVASGIHYHMALNQKIEYIATDHSRQVIPWVRAVDPSGKVTIYRSDGKTSNDPPPDGELRMIDCMDCHNRPSHVFQPPDYSVNLSLETGRIDRRLPYIKKVAAEALTGDYNDENDANEKIAQYIRNFYQKPDSKFGQVTQSAVNQAIDEVRAIYMRSFFPRMQVDWKTYPNDIGHMIFNGCFRCHDNRHISNDKGALTKECNICHEFYKPESHTEIQNAVQWISLEHPVKLEGEHSELICTSCHDGGVPPDPTCGGCHKLQTAFRRGTSPEIEGVKGTPVAAMADLDCQSCHDLSKPQTEAVLAAQCESCHEKGYGEMMKTWKQEMSASRAKAAAALENLRKALDARTVPRGKQEELEILFRKLQDVFNKVEKAGAQHNTDFADAIYQQIVKSAGEKGVPQVAVAAGMNASRSH